MTTLTAPESSRSILESDTYEAVLREVDVQDWTEQPDQFGKQGHYTLVLKFDITDGDDETHDKWAYVRFATGDKATLTKITRAWGIEDILPGQDVECNDWIGNKCRVVVEQYTTDTGNMRDKIVNYLPIRKGKADGGKAITAAGVRYMSQEQADKLLAKLAEFKQITGRDYPEEIADPLPVADLKRIVEDINARILEFEKVPF